MTQSTIDPDLPQQDTSVSASGMRGQFAAAVYDINLLFGGLAGEIAARIVGDLALAAAIAAHTAPAFIFTQSTPLATWVIVHNLGVFPSITVADSAGTIVDGDINFNDLNTATLHFSAAFSGTAYLI